MTTRQWHRDRFIPSDACVHVECSECGREYWLPKSKAGKYPTCGGDCSVVRRRRLIAERNRPCAVCGKEFAPRNAQIKAGIGNYCSHKCQGVAQSGCGNPMAGKSITDEQKDKWRAARDRNDSWLRGSKSPNWIGGWRVRYERDMALGKFREAGIRRRSKAAYIPSGTVRRLLNLQRGRCAICGVLVGDSYHVDHIVPLALDGSNHFHNLQIACPRCNLRKNKKDPIRYMQSLGKLL